MTKQLLIYETAVPLSAARHAQVSLDVSPNYAFSAGVNAVPLMAVELVRAATEYAVVFTAAGDDVATMTASTNSTCGSPGLGSVTIRRRPSLSCDSS